MINLRTGISLILFQLIPTFSNAQADSSSPPPPQPAAAAAPEPYSFEMADSLVRLKKYERAVWTYINLYPEQPDSVVVLVQRLRPAVPESDLPAFIQTTFARFAPMDPAISTFDFGGPTLDSEKLKIKAGWSDALIKRVAPDTLGMDSFSPK